MNPNLEELAREAEAAEAEREQGAPKEGEFIPGDSQPDSANEAGKTALQMSVAMGIEGVCGFVEKAHPAIKYDPMVKAFYTFGVTEFAWKYRESKPAWLAQYTPELALLAVVVAFFVQIKVQVTLYEKQKAAAAQQEEAASQNTDGDEA